MSPSYGFGAATAGSTWPPLDGMYASINGGASWTRLSNGIHDILDTLNVLAISPGFVSDGTIFTGSRGNGVYRTTTHAALWSAANQGIDNVFVTDLALSPGFASDQVMFAGTQESGPFRSTNAGASWNQILDSEPWSRTCRSWRSRPTMHPGWDCSGRAAGAWGCSARRISGADWASGVRSGTMWMSTAWPSRRTMPAPTSILAATSNGMYRSEDRGATWQASSSGIIIPLISRVAVSPNFARDRTVFAGTELAGLYKSTDQGYTWSQPGMAGTAGQRQRAGHCRRTTLVDSTVFVGGDASVGLAQIDGPGQLVGQRQPRRPIWP